MTHCPTLEAHPSSPTPPTIDKRKHYHLFELFLKLHRLRREWEQKVALLIFFLTTYVSGLCKGASIIADVASCKFVHLDQTCNFLLWGLYRCFTRHCVAMWPTNAYLKQTTWCRHSAIFWEDLKQRPQVDSFGECPHLEPIILDSPSWSSLISIRAFTGRKLWRRELIRRGRYGCLSIRYLGFVKRTIGGKLTKRKRVQLVPPLSLSSLSPFVDTPSPPTSSQRSCRRDIFPTKQHLKLFFFSLTHIILCNDVPKQSTKYLAL